MPNPPQSSLDSFLIGAEKTSRVNFAAKMRAQRLETGRDAEGTIAAVEQHVGVTERPLEVGMTTECKTFEWEHLRMFLEDHQLGHLLVKGAPMLGARENWISTPLS